MDSIFYGTVSEIDYEKGYVKVVRENIKTSSEWLQVLQGSTKNKKDYDMPEMEEVGLCICPTTGQEGYYIRSGYNEVDIPPEFAREGVTGTKYKDGTKIYYDANSGTLYLDVLRNIIIDCPQISIKGNVDIIGTLTVSEDTIADGVSLVNHQNTGVTPGGALTGPPAK